MLEAHWALAVPAYVGDAALADPPEQDDQVRVLAQDYGVYEGHGSPVLAHLIGFACLPVLAFDLPLGLRHLAPSEAPVS